jgi:hypothetical protein
LPDTIINTLDEIRAGVGVCADLPVVLPPPCRYRLTTDTGRNHCRIGRFGGFPSLGVCEDCARTPVGTGDYLARILHPFVAFAVETWRGRSRWHLGQAYFADCCGCAGRQALLNRAIPYGRYGIFAPIVTRWKGAA